MSWVFDPKERRVARCIEVDHPQWYVTWGVYSRTYCAFPLFDCRPGTIVRAGDARELVALMREAEIESGPQRRPRIPGSLRLPPARQHAARLEPPEPPAEDELPEPYAPEWPAPEGPEWPAPGDPESRPSEEPAFLPSEPESDWQEDDSDWPEDDDDWPEDDDDDWPEDDEAEAGAVRRSPRYRRFFGAARRG
jgi:hypothetical protein